MLEQMKANRYPLIVEVTYVRHEPMDNCPCSFEKFVYPGIVLFLPILYLILIK